MEPVSFWINAGSVVGFRPLGPEGNRAAPLRRGPLGAQAVLKSLELSPHVGRNPIAEVGEMLRDLGELAAPFLSVHGQGCRDLVSGEIEPFRVESSGSGQVADGVSRSRPPCRRPRRSFWKEP